MYVLEKGQVEQFIVSQSFHHPLISNSSVRRIDRPGTITGSTGTLYIRTSINDEAVWTNTSVSEAIHHPKDRRSLPTTWSTVVTMFSGVPISIQRLFRCPVRISGPRRVFVDLTHVGSLVYQHIGWFPSGATHEHDGFPSSC